MGHRGDQERADVRTLSAQQIELGEAQLESLQQSTQFQDLLFDLFGSQLEQQQLQTDAFNAAVSPEEQADFFQSQFEGGVANQAAQQELLQLELERIRQGGRATPEQERLIGQITEQGISLGSADVDRFVTEGLGQLGDEVANARGLSFTDSPILDRGNRLVQEGIFQKGQLTRGLRQAEANSLLNFPLASAQVFGAQSQGQQSLANAIASFQQSLGAQNAQFQAQNAFTTGQLGTGLANFFSGSSAISGLGNVLGALPGRTDNSFGRIFGRNAAASLGQTLGTGGANAILTGASAGIAAGCWVAAELYGWFTPEWYSARRFIFERWEGALADGVRAFYLKHGPALAEMVRQSPALRAMVKPWFDEAVRLGT